MEYKGIEFKPAIRGGGETKLADTSSHFTVSVQTNEETSQQQLELYYSGVRNQDHAIGHFDNNTANSGSINIVEGSHLSAVEIQVEDAYDDFYCWLNPIILNARSESSSSSATTLVADNIGEYISCIWEIVGSNEDLCILSGYLFELLSQPENNKSGIISHEDQLNDFCWQLASDICDRFLSYGFGAEGCWSEFDGAGQAGGAYGEVDPGTLPCIEIDSSQNTNANQLIADLGLDESDDGFNDDDDVNDDIAGDFDFVETALELEDLMAHRNSNTAPYSDIIYSAEAIYCALCIGGGDVVRSADILSENISVLNASKPCRHLLSGGCFRSDCWFDHQLSLVPCRFWLLEGPGCTVAKCPFMHRLIEPTKSKSEINGSLPEFEIDSDDFPDLSAATITDNSIEAPRPFTNAVKKGTSAAIPAQSYKDKLLLTKRGSLHGLSIPKNRIKSNARKVSLPEQQRLPTSLTTFRIHEWVSSGPFELFTSIFFIRDF